jgi:hypothetical protein
MTVILTKGAIRPGMGVEAPKAKRVARIRPTDRMKIARYCSGAAVGPFELASGCTRAICCCAPGSPQAVLAPGQLAIIRQIRSGLRR